VLHNVVEIAYRAEASYQDKVEEEVEDHLTFDSWNKDEGEAARERIYLPGSVLHAYSGDDLDCFHCKKLQ
jgi:hypothetical protein